MKRLLMTLVVLMTIIELQAQDIILLRNAEEINGKVVEIGSEELKYRRADMPDGPLYSIKLNTIFSVTYANGITEGFNVNNHSKSNASYGEYPYPNVSKTYKVGDFFDEDGVRGIVINTTDNGKHGLILSCVESPTVLPWGFTKKGERIEVFEAGTRNRDDGWENMKIIADIIDKTELRWSDFPAFNFCRDLGPGWYLPAINEVMAVFNLASERPVKGNHFKPWKEVNECLKGYASYGVDDLGYRGYYSSTEVDYYEVYFMTYENWIKYLDEWYYGKKVKAAGKNGEYSDKYMVGKGRYVRAVHKF